MTIDELVDYLNENEKDGRITWYKTDDDSLSYTVCTKGACVSCEIP